MLETENRSEYQVFIKKDGKACTLNTDDKTIYQCILKSWSTEGDISIEDKRVKNKSDQKVRVRDWKRGLNIKGIYSHMAAHHPPMTVVSRYLMPLLTSTDSCIHMVHIDNTKACTYTQSV